MKKRLSKFEVIRILAMFLIVLHHSVVHGVCDVKQGYSMIVMHPLNSGIAYATGSGGIIGIYLFVLITGFFMINSQISFGKLIKLWLPIFFWSVLIFAVFGNNLNIKDLIMAMFPILFGKYWFMTVYIFMYCLIPVLNVAVNNIKSKREFYYLGIISLFIIGSAFPKWGLSIIASRLANFCIIYCLGAIIRKNAVLKNKECIQIAKKSFISLIIISVLGIIALTYIGGTYNKIILIKIAKDIVIRDWTFIGIAEAVSLFLIIGSANIKYYPVINRTATCMFGIYLISDNPYMENVIWHQIFNMGKTLSYSWWLMLSYILGVTIIVFVCCSILEYIRQLLFSRLENWFCIKGNRLQNKLRLVF